ncbi:hypothetical protein N7541_010334 [Penicillium brevicompactum]|uniref:Uncharacterized protein n=1 Tax=Penicillium brevicompactum TaxID=5074 RepID=A0A9W9UIZ9_PENBR|nr:hypothetical protein N7541_010334 [Penicillium brevicompactum]
MRGRAGSNASSRSTQSAASTQASALHQQRQMNYWNSPISIEQVVKRLTSELKSAKQQTTDLGQTDDFLTTIMKPGYAEKEKMMKPSPLEASAAHRQLNGRPKMPRVDSFSRFSDPPAPPPQQPLPEKPDALSRSASESFSSLKRSDTEKPKGGTGSPVSRDSSQILSLIEALSTAKREIDTQGTRVKELESMLLQEQAARKLAEERINELETRPAVESKDTAADYHVPILENGADDGENNETEDTVQVNGVHPSEDPAPQETQTEPPVEDKSAGLQVRLDAMMEEMEEMRKQIASFKGRAEHAEDNTNQARKSLAEMVETLRKERAEKTSVTVSGSKSAAHDHSPAKDFSGQAVPSDGPVEPKANTACVDSANSHKKEIDAAATAFASQHQRHNYLEEASPYASIFGVVLLGVGLMAYLNGWQKMDK